MAKYIDKSKFVCLLSIVQTKIESYIVWTVNTNISQENDKVLGHIPTQLHYYRTMVDGDKPKMAFRHVVETWWI